jgi:hypothetical protein
VTGRRTLVEGLKSRQKADRHKEEAFVFGKKEKPQPTARPPKAAPAKTGERGGDKPPPPPPAAQLQALAGRVPLTTRIRPEMATALKRASLERQLAGETPNTVQDILEQALEPWLKDRGYLKD